MKAISLHQPWANLIRNGQKTIETRFWPTKYRGRLVICSTKNPKPKGEMPFGYALCLVTVTDCIPMEKEHEKSACIEWRHDRWAWVLEDTKEFFQPFPVKGRQGFFNIDIPESAWQVVEF